jgi:hypothetical protein
MLGKETVVVPAGSFEVTVFESRQEMKVDPSSPAPAPRGAPVIKSYVADGVGVVKTAIMSTVPRPIVQHQPDAGTAAAMQQGLAKLAKGMVPSLPKLRQPPAASGSQEFEEVEVENVTELIAYREAK